MWSKWDEGDTEEIMGQTDSRAVNNVSLACLCLCPAAVKSCRRTSRLPLGMHNNSFRPSFGFRICAGDKNQLSPVIFQPQDWFVDIPRDGPKMIPIARSLSISTVRISAAGGNLRSNCSLSARMTSVTRSFFLKLVRFWFR